MIADLQEEMLTVLEERFAIKRSDVTLDSRLREDLDLDSIDLFDIMGMIEKKTGVSVHASDFIKARTFGDFVKVLESLVQKSVAA